MATVKKAKKYREGGDIPCPGGKCKPSGKSSSRTVKTDGYTPGKPIRWSKKEEAAAEASARAKEPYERDFPGDSAPAGFGGNSEGKKSTRWRTDEKKGIRYVGQATKGKTGVKVSKAQKGKTVGVPYPKDKNMSAQDSASFRMGYGKSKGDDSYSGITSNAYFGKGQAAKKATPNKSKSGASVKKAKMGCMSCGGKMKKK